MHRVNFPERLAMNARNLEQINIDFNFIQKKMKPLAACSHTQAHRTSTGANDINFFNRSSTHLLWLPLYLTVKYLISSREIDPHCRNEEGSLYVAAKGSASRG